MSGRRIQLSAWQCLILETSDGPVRLRVCSDDPNPYVDLDLEAPPGTRLHIVSLPPEERPKRIYRKVARRGQA